MNKNDEDRDFNFFIKFFVFVIIILIVSGVSSYYFNLNIIPALAVMFFVFVILFMIMISIYSKMEIRRIELLAKKEKLKEVSDYYRDKLKNYSPGILMYCFMNKIDFEDYLIATIINLEYNNYIEINDDKITVLDKEHDNLSLDEKYIIMYLKKGKFREVILNKDNRRYIRNMIFNDTLNNKLYLKSKIYSFFTIVFAVSLITLMVLSLVTIVSSKEAFSSIIIVFFVSALFVIYGSNQQ